MSEAEIPATAAPSTEPLAERPKKLGIGIWAGIVVLIGFVIFGLGAFRQTLTPYVSFGEARDSKRTIQVSGALVKGSDRYDDGAKELHFRIQDDKKDELDVTYSGIKPANFHDALSVVAIGKWDGKSIRAEKLLVKCPSKYQGQEVEMSYSSKASS